MRLDDASDDADGLQLLEPSYLSVSGIGGGIGHFLPPRASGSEGSANDPDFQRWKVS